MAGDVSPVAMFIILYSSVLFSTLFPSLVAVCGKLDHGRVRPRQSQILPGTVGHSQVKPGSASGACLGYIVNNGQRSAVLHAYVEVSRNAYMKSDEIKKLNHPILDLNDVFCVQGD